MLKQIFNRSFQPGNARTSGLMRFEQVRGSWSGNDYKSVSVTRVVDGTGFPTALIFMTHLNIDYDGAPNAYGPPGYDTLDYLENAGKSDPRGYYGLMAVDPKQFVVVNGKKILLKDHLQLDLETDSKLADKKGRLPVKQKTGQFKGYYVSTTSKRNPNGSTSQYEQSHYLDSSTVAYYATSYGIESKGIGADDFGIALRLDTFRTASFSCLQGEGHRKGSAKAYALGECSYKVFLDIGGTPKKKTQKYADNNFQTLFILFPGAKSSNLWRLSMAANSYDLAKFIAIQAIVDRRTRGKSGMTAFGEYGSANIFDRSLDDGIISQSMNRIIAALQEYGYNPQGSVLSLGF